MTASNEKHFVLTFFPKNKKNKKYSRIEREKRYVVVVLVVTWSLYSPLSRL